ncbi:autotransporter domain-containing protein [Rhodoligotrophos ferricapiens]|uniref:autotransporter domain-containing protein n=1 Tax=Rhodoligotrophos ferricapiens TaxID=3069264 RepID=UPI00315C6797
MTSNDPPNLAVSISNLTLENGRARGGDGGTGDSAGGGGMGAGGAIFVGKNVALTASNVNFSGNAAIGGNGAIVAASTGGGGGGGLNGGNGGNGFASPGGGGGGGGLGVGSDGGNGTSSAGGAGGSPRGGVGGGVGANGSNGGFGGGGGGGGANGSPGGQGGNGGFGGGGGGGGFHGPSGGGGFGGGQGDAPGSSAPAGFGGGTGPSATHQQAGGGAGFGGALFVEGGGSVILEGNLAISGGSAQRGQGGLDPALGLGSGFFLNGTTGITVDASGDETITIADAIDSDAYNSLLNPGDRDPARDGVDAGITKTGNGTLVLGGTNSYAGGTNVQGGIVSVSSAANLGHRNSQVSLSNNAELLATRSFTSQHNILIGEGGGTLSADPGATMTLNGLISGTGLFTKDGEGTVVLGNGGNTYSGPTTIRAGTLRTGAAGALGAGAITIDAGGILDLNNFDQTVAALIGDDGGEIQLGSATLTVNQDIDTTYEGIITGTGGLTKEGEGTLTLQGVNTYSGMTTINEGTLMAGIADVIADSVVNIGATGIFDLNDLSQTVAGLIGAAGAEVQIGSATLTVDQTSDTTFGGIVTGTGDFIKTGGGILTVGGELDNTGYIIVSGGTLRAGADNIFGEGLLSIENNATLDLAGHDQSLSGFSDLDEPSQGTIELGGATLTLTGNGDYVFDGDIIGDGQIVKSGSGTFTYGGEGQTNGSLTTREGAFMLAGSLDAATVIIETGAELFGTGSAANVVVYGAVAAGSLAPHEVLENRDESTTGGELTITHNLTLEAGSSVYADLAEDGTMQLISVDGSTTINGGSIYVLDDGERFDPDMEYVLIESKNGITGEFDELVSPNLAFLKGWLEYTETEVLLKLAFLFDPSLYTGNRGAVGSAVAGLLSDGTAEGKLKDLLNAVARLDVDEARRALWAMDAEIYSDATAAARRLLYGGDRMVTARFMRDPSPGVQFWTDYQYRNVDLGYDKNASSGTSSEHHQLFGVDKSINSDYGQALIGAYGGFTWANIDLDKIDQQASLMGPIFGVYGQWARNALKVYGRGSLAAPEVDATRRYGAGDVHLTAKGEYRMTAVGANLGASYDIFTDHVLITPFAEIGIQHLSRPKAEEHGADNAGLVLRSADLTSGDARLGAKVAFAPMAISDHWDLTPALSATYVRSFGSTLDKVESAFIGGPNHPFTTQGVDIGKDAANLSASIQLTRADGFANIRLGYGLGIAKYETSHTIGIAGSIFW